MNTAKSNKFAKTVGGIVALMMMTFSLVVPAAALSQLCACPDCIVVEAASTTPKQSKPACCANHAEKSGIDAKSIKQGKLPTCDCCAETDAPPALLASSRVLPSKDALIAIQTRVIQSTLIVVASAPAEPSPAAIPIFRPPPQRHHQLYCVFRT